MSTDANALIVVKPITITDSMLIASGSPPETNVPENDYGTWNSGSTYALGDRVILTSTHRIYESLQAANTNKDPTTEPLWWVEVGPTNRWAAFDTSVSTATAQANNITYVLQPNQLVNTVAALNVTGCSELNITMTSASAGSPGIVYQKTVDFTAFPASADWYSWFFAARSPPKQAVEFGLPAYIDAEIEFEFIGGSALSVGTIILGAQASFGLGIKYGARVGIQDYSRKETNDFGDVVLVQRAFAKRADFDLFIESSEVDSLQLFLSEVRAVPCLWIASSEYEATTLFGFYKNFDILISYPLHADCTLEIEGLA